MKDHAPTKSVKGSVVVGWRERIDLPQLGLTGLVCKLDTGARTSAIHTESYEILERDGTQYVRCHFENGVDGLELELRDMRDVRSSSGHTEERPIVVTTLIVAGRSVSCEMSITNRSEMKIPILLGRTAMAKGRFLVDSRRSFLQSPKPDHRPKKSKRTPL